MSTQFAKKVKFVEDVSKAIVPFLDNVYNIEYRIFQLMENPSIHKEFLVIHYVGGGKTVRNCTGNSCSAILQEIAKYLDNGYYDEVMFMYEVETSLEWMELN